MKFEKTNIKGAFVIYTDVHEDKRGYFQETFNKREFDKVIPNIEFIQDNESQSTKNVLRGLHYQKDPFAQSKLVRCTQGLVYDVAVDLRKDSPTYLKWQGVLLSEKSGKQFFIPKGCAHGFVVISDDAKFQYKVDEYWHPESEDGINPFDETLDIDWGINKEDAILSDKDKNRHNLVI